jgi:C4-dicarboxylate-specific signal transduction histidine kinase
MRDLTHRFRAKLEASTVLRYALAPGCIALAALLQMFLSGRLPVWSDSLPPIHPTGLFQIWIVVAAWFGGPGAGFLAALLATLVLPRLVEMNYPLIAGFFDLPRFLAFAITGLALGWRTTLWRRAEAALRRSERELRKARDELERRVLEQTAELRRREGLLAEAEKLSRTGGFGWKPSTDEVLWSGGMFRILRYDRTTKPAMELVLQRVHPDDVALMKHTIERAPKDGQDFQHECRLLMPDGSIEHVHVVAGAVRDESGGVEFVGAMLDVTERRQGEEVLQRLQAELAHVTRVTTLGELAASIAHEVNQPLAAIVTDADASLNWLAAERPDLDMVRDALAAIVKDGHRAADVIQRIRQLATNGAPRKARLSLDDVVRDVVALVGAELRRHEVALALDLAPGLPSVLGDRVQLQQVLLNLVMNGIEAMAPVADRPRELAVRTGLHGDGHLLVAVQDTGVGIDPADVDRLFSAFFTTKPGGMGMGLSICRSIVEAHRGRLWATPNAGYGATFHFALPRIG